MLHTILSTKVLFYLVWILSEWENKLLHSLWLCLCSLCFSEGFCCMDASQRSAWCNVIYLLLWLVIFLITELIYLTYLRMYRSRQKTRKVKKKRSFSSCKNGWSELFENWIRRTQLRLKDGFPFIEFEDIRQKSSDKNLSWKYTNFQRKQPWLTSFINKVASLQRPSVSLGVLWTF